MKGDPSSELFVVHADTLRPTDTPVQSAATTKTFSQDPTFEIPAAMWISGVCLSLLLVASEILLPRSALPIKDGYVARVEQSIDQLAQTDALPVTGDNHLLADGKKLKMPAHRLALVSDSDVPEPDLEKRLARDLKQAVRDYVGEASTLPAFTLRHVENGLWSEVQLGKSHSLSETMRLSLVGTTRQAWERFRTYKVTDFWSRPKDKSSDSPSAPAQFANKNGTLILLSKHP